MVSVKKKEKQISSFDTLKLKTQLMTQFGFVSFVAVFSISLLIILFIQEEIISRILQDSSSYVVSRVELEMKNILLQTKSRMMTDFGFLGKFIYQVERATKDVFDQSAAYRVAYLALTTDAALKSQIDAQSGFCNTPTSTQSASMCGLIVTSIGDMNTCSMKSFIELDNTMETLLNSVFIKNNVFRVIIHQYQINTYSVDCQSFKVYPSHFIDLNKSEYISGSSFYNEQRSKMATSGTRSDIVIQGPYKADDMVSSPSQEVKVMSLSVTWKDTRGANIYYFHVRVELKLSFLQDIANSNNFRSYNEVIIVQKKGIFISNPSYWVIPSASSYIFDANLMLYSGIDQAMYTTLIQDLKQFTVTKLSPRNVNETYLVTPLLIDDTFNPNDNDDLYAQSVGSTSQSNFYIILLYGLAEQQYEVNGIIHALTDKQKYVTRVICIMTSIITLIIVYVATYLVSVQLSRPLRFLIGILQKLNNSVQIKQNALIQIKQQLVEEELQSQYQVKDLLISFKSLIETLVNRNQNNKNNLKKLTIDYPLNELEINFAKKTKGNQGEFDWEQLMSQIPDKSKFPDNPAQKGLIAEDQK